MRTQYKFIEFIQEMDWWVCRNKVAKVRLGLVYWYHKWKTYIFEPETGSEFSPDCLDDISDFCKQANEERKAGKR